MSPTSAVPPKVPPLISATELSGLLRPGIRPVLLDVRWTLAGSDEEGYRLGHLPGAVFVDLDRDLAAPPGKGGRHPLPHPDDLQAAWRAAGLDDGSRVVVYDGGTGMAASRAWWLLRWSGMRWVRLLDGGLAAWTAHPDRPIRVGPAPAVRPGMMTVRPGMMPTVDADEAAHAGTGSRLLLDARAAERFRGEVEPLDPIAGHIPGAVNLPIADVLTKDGRFREPVELAATFAAVGAAPDSSVVASCGSGVTACQLILAGELAGLRLALYPGSYSQWCALGRPVAVGS